VVPAYIGFDATAPSLHVGNLVSIMLLRRLQQAGHKPVVVMGAERRASAIPPAAMKCAKCSATMQLKQHRLNPPRL
jgi:hypothetical protein